MTNRKLSVRRGFFRKLGVMTGAFFAGVVGLRVKANPNTGIPFEILGCSLCCQPSGGTCAQTSADHWCWMIPHPTRPNWSVFCIEGFGPGITPNGSSCIGVVCSDALEVPDIPLV